jgi:hypothetical protein
MRVMTRVHTQEAKQAEMGPARPEWSRVPKPPRVTTVQSGGTLVTSGGETANPRAFEPIPPQTAARAGYQTPTGPPSAMSDHSPTGLPPNLPCDPPTGQRPAARHQPPAAVSPAVSHQPSSAVPPHPAYEPPAGVPAAASSKAPASVPSITKTPTTVRKFVFLGSDDCCWLILRGWIKPCGKSI